jgi:hypothetical protein
MIKLERFSKEFNDVLIIVKNFVIMGEMLW